MFASKQTKLITDYHLLAIKYVDTRGAYYYIILLDCNINGNEDSLLQNLHIVFPHCLSFVRGSGSLISINEAMTKKMHGFTFKNAKGLSFVKDI